MQEYDKRPSRLATLPLAILFLVETWIWRRLVGLASSLAGLLPWAPFRDAARRVVNKAPAPFAVLLFGVPLFVSEFGAFISVVLMATGHLVMGATLYVGMKIFGLVLVPVIFEITREKLMTLAWFVWVYAKFEALHAMASRFVAPYRLAAAELAAEGWRAAQRWFQPRSAPRANAAKAATLASSARAVGSRPAPPSH